MLPFAGVVHLSVSNCRVGPFVYFCFLNCHYPVFVSQRTRSWYPPSVLKHVRRDESDFLLIASVMKMTLLHCLSVIPWAIAITDRCSGAIGVFNILPLAPRTGALDSKVDWRWFLPVGLSSVVSRYLHIVLFHSCLVPYSKLKKIPWKFWSRALLSIDKGRGVCNYLPMRGRLGTKIHRHSSLETVYFPWSFS